MKHTISVLVENEFGVLTRVSGLFSGRGYNITSLTVAETLDPSVSLMTIVTKGDDRVIEQIIKQLDKLVSVIKVTHVNQENAINRILALIKVKNDPQKRIEMMKSVELLGGDVVDVKEKVCIVEIQGDEEKINSALNMLKPYGVEELVQTGSVAMLSQEK